MKGSDQVKRIPVIFLRYIVFFIPAIIISIMLWNHYQDDLENGKITENDVQRIFAFDEGKRVVSAVSKDQQLHYAMYDPRSGKRIKEWTTASSHCEICIDLKKRSCKGALFLLSLCIKLAKHLIIGEVAERNECRKKTGDGPF